MSGPGWNQSPPHPVQCRLLILARPTHRKILGWGTVVTQLMIRRSRPIREIKEVADLMPLQHLAKPSAHKPVSLNPMGIPARPRAGTLTDAANGTAPDSIKARNSVQSPVRIQTDPVDRPLLGSARVAAPIPRTAGLVS